MAGALLLIAVGVMFLLNNLGVVRWDVWASLWRLWPLILIAIGLDLMFKRRRLGVLLGVVVLAAIIAPLAVWLSTRPFPLRTERFSRALEGATEAEVELKIGTASLTLGALGKPDLLAEGTLRLGKEEELHQTLTREGGSVVLELSQEGELFSLFSDEDPSWEIRLSPALPLTLTIDAGVGESAVDLTGLAIRRLRVHTGVGRTTVVLPAKGSFEARVEGGVGETIVRIPANLSAQIRASSGLGALEVSDAYPRDGEIFRSPGYDAAADRVDLRVSGGVGRVAIETLPASTAPAPTVEEKKPAEAPLPPQPVSP
jgi:hypothetical protein